MTSTLLSTPLRGAVRGLRVLTVGGFTGLDPWMTNWGYEVRSASDANGLSLWKSFAPDVVIIDLETVPETGMALAMDIRSESRGVVPLIVALSAPGQAPIRPLPSWCDFVIRKPVDRPFLKDCLRHYLEALNRGRLHTDRPFTPLAPNLFEVLADKSLT